MSKKSNFLKKKAKTDKQLKRTINEIEPYDRVLIVCEGEKTEPLYFEELKDFLKLSTANIKITGDCDSSPSKVVEYAIQEYKENQKSSAPNFDKVFCVFDRDGHSTFEGALLEIKKQKPKGVFEAITSTPCFEYWLLLHFTNTSSAFVKSGKKSACEMVIKELEKHLPDYEKASEDTYPAVQENEDTAIMRSKNRLEDSILCESPNPSTNIHDLVEYLKNLKKKRR